MTIDDAISGVRLRHCRSVADVAEMLMAKYEATLPLNVISSTVCATARSMERVAGARRLADTILRVSDGHLASMAASL
jgi:hypothetical protein